MTHNENTKTQKKNIILLLAVLVILGTLAWAYIEKIKTIKIPEKAGLAGYEIAKGDKVPFLVAPEGFKVTYFAKDLPGVRVIDFDPYGRMLVTQTKEGKIATLLDAEGDGVAEEVKTLVSGLKNPHGMAWRCESEAKCTLFVGTSNALVSFPYDVTAGTVGPMSKLANISYSTTDNHFTRSLLFLPAPNQDTLLISIGSSCNVCNEKNAQYAKIMSYNIKTKVLEEYAKGLRNSVFLTMEPSTGKVFATEMGRDALGDDIPPDEINIIEKGKNYGWPVCYGKNIHDTEFDKKTYIRNPCIEPLETESLVDLQAHSAPLGISFVPENGWEENLKGSMLVAYHGSWNRSVPTGYKIVKIDKDAAGNYVTEDFITGWLDADGKKLGRPVDIKVVPQGLAYITDDMNGVIYKLSRE